MAPQAWPTSWLEGHKGQGGALPEAQGGAQGPRAQEGCGRGERRSPIQGSSVQADCTPPQVARAVWVRGDEKCDGGRATLELSPLWTAGARCGVEGGRMPRGGATTHLTKASTWPREHRAGVYCLENSRGTK